MIFREKEVRKIKIESVEKEKRLGQINLTKQGHKITIIEYKNYNNVIVQFNDDPNVKKITSYRHFLDGNVMLPKNYRVGMSKINKQGCLMRIIEYNNATDVIVEFEDDNHTQKHITWSMFKNNTVHNPSLPKASSKPHNSRKSKPNSYELNQNYGIGYTTKGEKFYFDLDDYELIRTYRWHIDDSGYVSSGESNKKIRMHKLILENLLGLDYFKEEQLVCDHINRIKNDNRKRNLRIVTSSVNGNNKEVVDQGGVSYSIYHQKWIAYINYENTRYHLGYFKNEKQAKKKRDQALEQVRNGTFKFSSRRYSKDRFIYEGHEYNLTELCRLLGVNKDYARYQIYKKNTPLIEIFNTNIAFKGDADA